MEHETAIQSLAAERYLLNEMTPEERDEFEEHYFVCRECADAVRTGTALMVNVREAAGEQAMHPSRPGQVAAIRAYPGNSRNGQSRRWMGGISAAAAAALLMVVGGHDLLTMARLKQPRSAVRELLHAQTRAPSKVVKLTGDRDAVLDLELGGERELSSCRIELLRRGKVINTISNAPVRDGTTDLEIPGGYPSGTYVILVRAPSDDAEVGRFPVQIDR